MKQCKTSNKKNLKSLEVLLLKVACFIDFKVTRKKTFYFPDGAIAQFDETEKLAVLTLIFDSLSLVIEFLSYYICRLSMTCFKQLVLHLL